MHIVFDTNILISAFVYRGVPLHLLNAARRGEFFVSTSLPMMNELRRILSGAKFAGRLRTCGLDANDLCKEYGQLAAIVCPAAIPPTIADDPDDDKVLACAVAARADAIVSGDRHLLELHEFRGIPIIAAAELLRQIQL